MDGCLWWLLVVYVKCEPLNFLSHELVGTLVLGNNTLSLRTRLSQSLR